MILADQTQVLGFIVGIAILVGLVFGALFLYRGYEHLARRSLERQVADLAIHSDPQPGDVILVYHTYHGILAWITQTPHHVALPTEDARILLGRLFRFNFKWGLVSFGLLFIPLLSILNYISQRRSITAQESTGASSASMTPLGEKPINNAPEKTSITTAESPSAFHRFVGWIAAGLCIIFAITFIECLVTGEYEGAIGGVVVTVLLGWIAKKWLVPH